MRFTVLCVAASVFAGSAVWATDYTVTPNDLASFSEFSAPHGWGNNPFAYDWDSSAPEVKTGAPTGWGSSSFYGNVVKNGSTPSDRYRTFRVGMRDLFGGPVYVKDVSSISYYANQLAAGGNWGITLYTAPGAPGASKSWYSSRFQTGFTNSAGLNQWVKWSTDDNLTFYDSNKGVSGLHWIDVINGSKGSAVFGNEEVMMIDFALGYNSPSITSQSQLDGISIIANGKTANINCEAAVPEPMSVVLGIMGLSTVAGFKRLRKK